MHVRSPRRAEDERHTLDFPVGPFENERLSFLYESGLLDGAPNPVLEDLCRLARERFDVEMALVTLLEEDFQVFRAKCGVGAPHTPRDVAFCNYTILEDHLFIVPDARKDPIFRTNPLVSGEPYLRFYAGAPLTCMENIRLGAFCLLDRQPRELSPGEREELREYAERVVAELIRMITWVA